MLNGREITVIGAGIGGLAAAVALRLQGAAVRVLERAPEIAEVGAGLQISPNGVAVLEALGLAGMAEAESLRARGVRLRDYRRGRQVLHLDLARHAPGQRYLLMHRADLIGLLERAARHAGVTIETGREVLDVWEAGEGARIALADGSSETVPLVLGADGLHSRLRPALNGEARPFFTGQVAWRALVPAPAAAPAEAHVWMGPGRHLVTYPLRGGRLMNLVAVREEAAWTAEGWAHPGDPEELRAAFADFAPEARALLDKVEAVHVWGLFRHPVAARWHGQASALLGDAAHPTLPFLAQGANLALEDAWVLAACLARSPAPAALEAYQARRRPRVARAIAAANANARNYHLRNPLLRGAAHTALRLGGALLPAAPLRRFDWLYGHDVTAEIEVRPNIRQNWSDTP
jgi:salicylate hydroxylase